MVNDDGPVSTSSPYIYPFVTALQAAGHETSVVLPHIPCSWIGKAHIVEATLECSYYTPAPGSQEWVLVTGTPASCTQLGLHHLFQDLPPVDLVISGPNFGRNATTIYNLSSGTVGGALEAALCRKKAIAISFASKDHQSKEVIAAAARISVRLIERLYRKWGPGVELYNINVPMIAGVEKCQIMYTQALSSSWSSSRLYEEVSSNVQLNSGNGHLNGAINGQIRQRIHGDSRSSQDSADQRDGPNKSVSGAVNGHLNGNTSEDRETLLASKGRQGGPKETVISKRKYFKWAPELSDIVRCVEESSSGTDAWAVKHGCIRYGKCLHCKKMQAFLLLISLLSVTPLKANFLHVQGFTGRLEL